MTSATTQPGDPAWVVVDVETTGLSPREHRIVELAVVILDLKGAPLGEASTLLDPGGDLGSVEAHGIRPEHLAGAPRFGSIAGWLQGWLAGKVVVGHNLLFTTAFLDEEYRRVGVSMPHVPVICTMTHAPRYLPSLPGRTLEQCCAAAGIPIDGPRSALSRARAASALFARFLAHRETLPSPWLDSLDKARRLAWPHTQVRDFPLVRRPEPAVTEPPREVPSIRATRPADGSVPSIRATRPVSGDPVRAARPVSGDPVRAARPVSGEPVRPGEPIRATRPVASAPVPVAKPAGEPEAAAEGKPEATASDRPKPSPRPRPSPRPKPADDPAANDTAANDPAANDPAAAEPATAPGGDSKPDEAEHVADMVEAAPRQPGESDTVATYLGAIDSAVSDRILSFTEAIHLKDLASALAIFEAEQAEVHRTYLRNLASTAWTNHQLTEAERDDLLAVGKLLEVPEDEVDQAIADTMPRRPNRHTSGFASIDQTGQGAIGQGAIGQGAIGPGVPGPGVPGLGQTGQRPHSGKAQVASQGQAPAVAAWYPDPYGEARLRWWDGTVWTAHLHD